MPSYRGNPNRWISHACLAGNHDKCPFPRLCDCCFERTMNGVAIIVFGGIGLFFVAAFVISTIIGALT